MAVAQSVEFACGLKATEFVLIGKNDIFKPTIAKESLHEISNYNGVNVVSFKHIIKSPFPHRNMHKYNWEFPDGKTQNPIEYILIDG
jgi:hypothetical protein